MNLPNLLELLLYTVLAFPKASRMGLEREAGGKEGGRKRGGERERWKWRWMREEGRNSIED